MGKKRTTKRTRRGEILIRCMGHKSIKLKPGTKIKIGRQEEGNDLVLKDGTVSRHHATIVWDEDEDRPYIVDHESANGVEIDGMQIDERGHLHGDNHVDIGDFTLILEWRGEVATSRWSKDDVVEAAMPGGGDLEASGDPDADGEAAEHLIDKSVVVRLYGEKGKEFKGDWESPGEIQGILSQLEEEGRTGTLKVRMGTYRASITMSMGMVVTAQPRAGDTDWGGRGRPLLRMILTAEKGAYLFTRNLSPSDENLNISPKKFIENDLDEGGTARFEKADEEE